MVAVARADQHRQVCLRPGPAQQIRDIGAGGARERPQTGIGSAERLEAAERPAAFVLGVNSRDAKPGRGFGQDFERSEEHTSELQSLMRISYAVFCLKKKNK